LCRGPAGSPFLIAISVLIGAWTHVFLDALTHGNGWFVEHLSFLQAQVTVGNHQARVCDLLYAACTFLGAAWVASAYLNWLERAAGNSGWVFPGFKWISTLVVATVTLLLSFGSRGAFPSLGLFALGILTVILVILFLAVTGWGLRNARRPQPGGSRLPSG
ncbi:MAG: DUF4184 family protein, partial [Verrucomicrobia bacterium]|nr:DUF4184 family protein [Verrucomicrobiota bacterium]